MVPGWFFVVFMVPGVFFLCFFMVPGWFFMVPGRSLCFLWFQVGFSRFQVGFHGFSWNQVGLSFCHIENTLKLYSGLTIQSRPCLWPSDNKFTKISGAKTKRQKIFVQAEKNGDLRLQQILHLIKVSFPIS